MDVRIDYETPIAISRFKTQNETSRRIAIPQMLSKTFLNKKCSMVVHGSIVFLPKAIHVCVAIILFCTVLV